MRKLIYGIDVSLDGYVAGPGDDLGWSSPSDELFQCVVEQEQAIGLLCMGAGCGDVVPTGRPATSSPMPLRADRARAGNGGHAEKVIFSSTEKVFDSNAACSPATRSRRSPGRGRGRRADEGWSSNARRGGHAAGLVENRCTIVTHPVLLGGGAPFFTALDSWVNLDLVTTRRFPAVRWDQVRDER